MKAWIVAGAVFASALAAPAFALEPRQCLSMTEMNASLVAEGQRTLIIGNRIAFLDGPGDRIEAGRSVNTFTSNADGSVGYNLEGDKPMGEPSTQVCVRAKFTNIVLYDARKPGTPQGAWRGEPFDAHLRENEAADYRPMLQGDAVTRSATGEWVIANGMTLLGRIAGQGAWLEVNYADGRYADIMFMGDVSYTPTALARIEAAD